MLIFVFKKQITILAYSCSHLPMGNYTLPTKYRCFGPVVATLHYKLKKMDQYNKPNRNSSATAGYILVAIGAIIFLSQIAPGAFRFITSSLRDVFGFLRGFLRWEFIPITVGLISGYKYRYGAPYGWLVPIAVGVFFLLAGTLGWNYIMPLLLVAFGLVIIMNAYTKPKINGTFEKKSSFNNPVEATIIQETTTEFKEPFVNTNINSTANVNTAQENNTNQNNWSTNAAFSNQKGETVEEYVAINAVFSGVEKMVNSKNFKGADLTAILGGIEINLLNADMPSPATIDVTSIMGGVKLIVPPHWEVKSQITTILGGVEDKRPQFNNVISDKKLLILKGTALMGGIDIKSF